MKALLCLCSILFFCTVSFRFTVALEATAVVDSHGNTLKVGTWYYVVSVIRGAGGGGLTLSNYPNEDCNITVSQEPLDTYYGKPCSFHPVDPKESTIHLSKSLNVKFEVSVPCANSTVWQVGNDDPKIKSGLIQIGGVLSNPGCQTFRSWFKIEKGPWLRSYKFVSDPDDVCTIPIARYNLSIGRPIDQPLFISKDDDPFYVVFIKINGANINKAYVQ